MTLKEELAARKEVILRKRAKQGAKFKGSKQIRDEYRKERKAVGQELRRRAKIDPDQEFMDSHLGLRPSEYQKFLDRVADKTLGPACAELQETLGRDITIYDLPRCKDGTVDKHYITSGSWENYPEGVYEKQRKLFRAKGLPSKRPDAKNLQKPSLKNIFGGGRPERQADLSEQDQKGINRTALNVQGSLDLHELPGFYDTAYTPETKLQAVVAWLLTGSAKQAAEYASVGHNTILNWKKTAPWWRPLATAIQQERAEELDAEMSNMIHRSMSELHDRITNGDYKYNAKLDKSVQVPIAARDLASIIDRMISNRNLLNGDPTAISEKRTVEQNLDMLRTTFKRMARGEEHGELIEAVEVEDESTS